MSQQNPYEVLALTQRKQMSGIAVPKAMMSSIHAFPFKDLRVQVEFPPEDLLPSEPMEDENEAWEPEHWVPSVDGPKSGWAPRYMLVTVSGSLAQLAITSKTHEDWRSADSWKSLEAPERNAIRTTFLEVLDEGFEYWLRVARWQTGSALLGRGLHAAGSLIPALVDAGRGEEVTGRGLQFQFYEERQLNQVLWADILEKLISGKEPPLALEYYFEGLYQLRLGDIRRAVMDLAISAELHMKNEVARVLPDGIHPQMAKDISRLSVRAYRERLFQGYLPVGVQARYMKIRSTLKDLAEDRNRVVHTGTAKSTAADCKLYADDVKTLLTLEAARFEPNGET